MLARKHSKSAYSFFYILDNYEKGELKMFSVTNRTIEYMKDLTTLSVLSGVLSLLRLISAVSIFSNSRIAKQAENEIRF